LAALDQKRRIPVGSASLSQLILDFRIGGFTGWLFLPEMMPVATRDQGGRFVLLTASPVWVRWPVSRSTGAPEPPILVRTQPGSTAFLKTFGDRRASAKAIATTCSLLSA
jgi:hypothetical protein